jgi:hypothetical protein
MGADALGPDRYDKGFWIDFLGRTKTQGVCLSAGGVTAFYPTKVPFHYRTPFLGNGDMLGELAHECKRMGIRVLGRVDPHAAHEDMLKAHPDWIAHSADGTPNFTSPAPMARSPSNGCRKC